MKASTFALAVAGLTLAAPAAAQPSSIFVFGDSLVDAGNARLARLATGGEDPAPPTLGYFDGRFSNGPTFADYTSEIFFGPGVYTNPSLAGGLNFAVGGAQALEVVGDASPSFIEQLAAFTGPNARMIDADALVIVTLGGNDVRRELALIGGNPAYRGDFTGTEAAMRTGLQTLFDAGARNILVTGLPNVGAIPAVPNIPFLRSEGLRLSTDLNDSFRDLVAEFRGATNANFTFFDFLDFQDRLYANPAAFGLPTPLNTTTPCIGTPASPACTNFVYFDPIHPTTGVHRAVSFELAAAAAVPEPATWAMMILGFGAVGTTMRRRRAQTAIA